MSTIPESASTVSEFPGEPADDAAESRVIGYDYPYTASVPQDDDGGPASMTTISAPTQLDALTYDQRRYLLAHLLRCPDIAELAHGRLEPRDLPDVGAQVAWGIARDHYRAHTSLPCRAAVMTELLSRLEQVGEGMPIADQAACAELLEFAFGLADDQLDPAVARELLSRFVLQVSLAPRIAELAAPGTTAETLARIDALRQTVENARLTTVERYTAGALGDVRFAGRVAAARTRTGFNVIDDLLGGIRDGELIGVLAPSGGGKTALGLQACVAVAEGGAYAMYVSYELPIVPTIRERVWANMAGVPIATFEGATVRGVGDGPFAPEAAERALRAAAERQGDRLSLIDMTGVRADGTPGQGFGGAAELEAIVRGDVAAGRPPRLVVIDWLGLMVRAFQAQHSESSPGSAELHHAFEATLSHLRRISATYRCAILVLHQTAPGAARRFEGSNGYEAEGSKKFPFLLDACLNIGSMPSPSDGTAKIEQSKARNDGRRELWIQYHPSSSRMTSLPGTYTLGANGSGRKWIAPGDLSLC